jgi:hypothetical protein
MGARAHAEKLPSRVTNSWPEFEKIVFDQRDSLCATSPAELKKRGAKRFCCLQIVADSAVRPHGRAGSARRLLVKQKCEAISEEKLC